MNKDEMKTIEEMAKVLCGNKCGDCEYMPRLCGYKSYCTRLYNAGYRKMADDDDDDDEIVESMKTYESARQETAREILQDMWNKRWSLTDLQFAICDMLAEYDIELKNTTYSEDNGND